MAYFIKTGFWEKAQKGFKGWLNLDDLIRSVSQTSNVASLTDAASVDISAAKSTLTSSAATRTFTVSYLGDDITIEVILNTTSATYTFPSNSLGVSEGTASGDNTVSLSGTSGDHYIIGVKNINGTYYVVAKNFGQ